jgi:hypothetical protein
VVKDFLLTLQRPRPGYLRETLNGEAQDYFLALPYGREFLQAFHEDPRDELALCQMTRTLQHAATR